MTKIIAANWKQNGSLKLLIKLTRDIRTGINRLKKRPKYNPLIVHYYNYKKLKNDCNLNDNFINYIKDFVLAQLRSS